MKLDALIRKLDAISTSSLLDTVKRRVAIAGLALIGAEFRVSADPYGVSWPLLKYPREGGPVLVKTGIMRDSIIAYPTPNGIVFKVATPYAAFHQYGTKNIPIRRMLPATFLGLPKPWADMVAATYNDVLRERLSA